MSSAEAASKMCLALLSVHPEGLPPKELQAAAHLTARQVRCAARYLRDTYADDPMPPVMYVRQRTEDVPGNTWYYCPSWADHVRPGLRSEFTKQSQERIASMVKVLEQARRAFPQATRRINKSKRTAEYLREELAELVEELA